jgi:uncharacterized protein YbjT (DUF2867 family)
LPSHSERLRRLYPDDGVWIGEENPPVRVGVVGGTGTLGALAAAELSIRGHDVYVLARHPPDRRANSAYRRVDLSTGEGLAEAVSDLDVVVDASNVVRPGREMRAVMVDGTERLLCAEARAAVGLHVLISIVGIGSVPMSYYRVKLEQERRVREAPVRSRVLRATQFYPLIDRVFLAWSRFGVLPAGDALVQPIDPREVALVLADAIESGSWDGRLEVAGPEILSLTALARAWLADTGRRRVLVPMPFVGRLGRALRAGAFTSEDAARGELRFADWLRRRPGVGAGSAVVAEGADW